MTLLLILILTTISSVFVGTTYLPSTKVIGKVSIDSLLNKNHVRSHNLTSEHSYANISNLARKHGYVIEEHKVTTADGYILGLHRLTTNRHGTNNGIPVFLMHGLLDSSDSWILQGPHNALGYLLVEHGYDVWMGNARGNKHSLTHTSLSPNEGRFWKFSWEEIGIYDLTAMIDYVLIRNGAESLYYVGHSQGTTSFFAMNSLKPDYKRKIRMMFALSPIAWLSHAHSPMLKYLSTIPATVLQYFQFFNTLTPSKDLLYQIYGTICKVVSTGCSNIFDMLFGNNYYVSGAMLPVILENASSSSVLQFVHYWQLYQSGRFCRFDHGWFGNLLEYGRFGAPDYDLSDVTVPIVLFYSGNDWLSHPDDVAILRSHLPNVYKNHYLQCFSHIDYMYASVAREAVYEEIIGDIQSYERKKLIVKPLN